MRIPVLAVLGSILMVSSTIPTLHAQSQAVYAAAATSKLVNFPGLPECMKGSVQNGDPSKGSSVILGKGTAGCSVPWRWHTPTEQLMMVAGSAKVEMKDGSPVILRAGDYASLPSKHVHQFTCQAACTLFIASDVAFDIHYVDSTGTEIAPEAALKSKAQGKTKK
jgi:quercetin dioxygenase-like cupin family protein